MKIIDVETKYTNFEELKTGTVINYYGDFVIVTDVTCSGTDSVCIIYLESGERELTTKSRMLRGINDPDQSVKIVKESTLTIEEYL